MKYKDKIQYKNKPIYQQLERERERERERETISKVSVSVKSTCGNIREINNADLLMAHNH